ncbi:MAG: tyrosine-type recombinase/integrase, partial [Candidatus Eremiobacteraeota bacterium]|nr:tyrosine-type recombinase/integrase [Candidatus Eremiobacteraeota bacterium]
DFVTGFVRVERGKGGKGRVVPIGRAALKWVRRYIDEVRPLARSQRSDVLFLSQLGRPLSMTTLHSRIIKPSIEAARIPFAASTHAFRHAAATHLLRGDGHNRRASLPHVRDILGHSSCDTTEHYTRIDITDLCHEISRRHFRDRAA